MDAAAAAKIPGAPGGSGPCRKARAGGRHATTGCSTSKIGTGQPWLQSTCSRLHERLKHQELAPGLSDSACLWICGASNSREAAGSELRGSRGYRREPGSIRAARHELGWHADRLSHSLGALVIRQRRVRQPSLTGHRQGHSGWLVWPLALERPQSQHQRDRRVELCDFVGSS